MSARKLVTKEMKGRYDRGSRGDRSLILDELVALTGWHRDHARKALRTAPPPGAERPPRRQRDPVLTYDEAMIEALRICWAVLDGPTGKRLAPALPLLVQSLRRHGELVIDDAVAELLCLMSAATIDRRLAPDRAQLRTGKGKSWTKPGSMLKSSIPIKTWSEWDDAQPGFAEIDLVGHDGGDNNGQFAWTLCLTDVALGWTEARTVYSKGERVVAAALEEIQLGLPFALLGLHSDSGSEFINHHLARWCQTHHITFTRSRPAHSNDNAYVEQKNWSVIRRCVGYYRYDTPREIRLLNQLWQLESVLTNLFTPQQKLIFKSRVGAKVTKRYDRAQTPAGRLLTGHHDLVPDHDRRQIKTALATVNPAELRRQIADIQGNLTYRAKRRGILARKPNRHAVYDSKTKISPPPRRASLNESTTHASRAS